MCGTGISWVICKQSAPRSRQITTPAPHHSVFTGWMPFLPPNQHCQSTEGSVNNVKLQQQKQNLCNTPGQNRSKSSFHQWLPSLVPLSAQQHSLHHNTPAHEYTPAIFHLYNLHQLGRTTLNLNEELLQTENNAIENLRLHQLPCCSFGIEVQDHGVGFNNVVLFTILSFNYYNNYYAI